MDSSLNGQLLKACQLGQTKEVEALIAKGAPLNELTRIGVDTERTPLMIAAENGRLDTLHILIYYFRIANENFDKATSLGNTALTCAIWGKQKDTLVALIEAGANPVVKIQGGDNAFILAARTGQFNILQTLFPYYKNKLEEKNLAGCTALFLAASSGNNECVSFLINAGADIFSTNIKNSTILMTASEDHIDIVKLLLPHYGPVALDAKDNNGFSAFMYAASNGQAEIAWLLVSHGAKVELNNPYINQQALSSSVHKQKEELSFLFLSAMPTEKMLALKSPQNAFAIKCHLALSTIQMEMRQIMASLSSYTEAFDNENGSRQVLLSYIYPTWYQHRADKDAQAIINELAPFTKEIRNLTKEVEKLRSAQSAAITFVAPKATPSRKRKENTRDITALKIILPKQSTSKKRAVLK